MSGSSAALVTVTTARLLHTDSPGSVEVAVSWHPSDPWCVRFTFVCRRIPEWEVSRDILRAAFTRPAGEGDVKLWARGPSLLLGLRSPNGQALLELPAAEVKGVLDQSYGRVSDVDAAIAAEAALDAWLAQEVTG